MEKVRPVRLRFLSRAYTDIAAIHEYIAQRSPRTATAVAAQIHLTSQLLARYPALGRKTDIAATARYPYLVYYRVQQDELVILHVRHARRDLPVANEL